MIKKILKGFHLSINSFTYPIIHGGYMRKKLMFDDSCKYILNNGDQKDWNKLLGFSFGFFPLFKQYMQHENSIRIGWRYNPEKNTIELTPYFYIDGVRNYHETTQGYTEIISLELNKEYILTLLCDVNGGYLKIKDENVCHISFFQFKNHKAYKGYGFNAPLYFGGNEPAPQNINILIEDL